jgi:hypothetical protein
VIWGAGTCTYIVTADCMTLGQSLPLSEPWFSQREMEINSLIPKCMIVSPVPSTTLGAGTLALN